MLFSGLINYTNFCKDQISDLDKKDNYRLKLDDHPLPHLLENIYRFLEYTTCDTTMAELDNYNYGA